MMLNIAVFISLLVVPSAVLWGLIRAVFKVNQDELSDMVKTAQSIHPVIGS